MMAESLGIGQVWPGEHATAAAKCQAESLTMANGLAGPDGRVPGGRRDSHSAPVRGAQQG